jgi:hypothetical protein
MQPKMFAIRLQEKNEITKVFKIGTISSMVSRVMIHASSHSSIISMSLRVMFSLSFVGIAMVIRMTMFMFRMLMIMKLIIVLFMMLMMLISFFITVVFIKGLVLMEDATFLGTFLVQEFVINGTCFPCNLLLFARKEAKRKYTGGIRRNRGGTGGGVGLLRRSLDCYGQRSSRRGSFRGVGHLCAEN